VTRDGQRRLTEDLHALAGDIVDLPPKLCHGAFYLDKSEASRSLSVMEIKPPTKGTGREIVELAVEAGVSSIPLVGSALAAVLVKGLSWKLERRQEEWFSELADGLEELQSRVDGSELPTLLSNDLFVDAVVSATRTITHTHEREKIAALRNAVLNSAAPDAPEADVQAIMLDLIDRFTASHFRLLSLWDDPPAWFAEHNLAVPQAAYVTNRTVTVEVGLPEMRGRKEIYMLVYDELRAAHMLTAELGGSVQPPSLMSRLTNDFGRQFVRFINPPATCD